ncbi:MAG: histidinol-phosphatase HisJ family protein [Candidatus Eisenbacteria bacterium]|jgi:histidinol-phosphatase (PHP family)|nr:histidinol-phosphatase HisJ family protein [Candidatus Eisenbacteria bacterium]
MPANLSDCHVHTEYSGDSELSLSWVLTHAEELNLGGVCPTEHCDPAPTDRRFMHLDLEGMFDRHRRLGASRPPVPLGIGLEVTYRPDAEERIREVLESRPFDLVIGSIHDLDGLYLREWLNSPARQAQATAPRIRPFVALTSQMVDSGLFRVVGHVDYVKRYVPGLTGASLLAMFHEEFSSMFARLLSRGGVLELNLSGLRHGCEEPYPSIEILRRYRALGGEAVTLGSDAHAPGHYVVPLSEGAELARTVGLHVIDWRSMR